MYYPIAVPNSQTVAHKARTHRGPRPRQQSRSKSSRAQRVDQILEDARYEHVFNSNARPWRRGSDSGDKPQVPGLAHRGWLTVNAKPLHTAEPGETKSMGALGFWLIDRGGHPRWCLVVDAPGVDAIAYFFFLCFVLLLLGLPQP